MSLQNKPSHLNEKIQRAQGALLGLACGDALGTTLEFKPKDSYIPLTDMVGGGPFKLRPGQWTDDTSMMLCLADSLIEMDGIDLDDQIQRYIDWYKHGKNSSTGLCFDIGNTVRDALERYVVTGNAQAASTSEYAAGNGSLMRIAPIALFYHGHPELVAMDAAAESSKTTHGEQRCVEACELMTLLIHRLLNVQCIPEKQVFLSKAFADFLVYRPHCHSDIRLILDGEPFKKTRSQIHGTGFVIASLEAALWCFIRSDSFADGVLLAANLGDDADTTAAIFGQLAGAFYSVTGIPEEWLAVLHWKSYLSGMAASLVQRPDVRQCVDSGIQESAEHRMQAVVIKLILSGRLRVTGSIKDVEAFGRFIQRKAAELIPCPSMGYSISFEHPLAEYEITVLDKPDKAIEFLRSPEENHRVFFAESEEDEEYEEVWLSPDVLAVRHRPGLNVQRYRNCWNPETKIVLHGQKAPLFELNIGADLHLVANISSETDIQQVTLYHKLNVNRDYWQRSLKSMMKQWSNSTVFHQEAVYLEYLRRFNQRPILLGELDVWIEELPEDWIKGRRLGVANTPEGIHIWKDVFRWQGSHEGYWERVILKSFPLNSDFAGVKKTVLAKSSDMRICQECTEVTLEGLYNGRCSGCEDQYTGRVY